jgi:hypothetical protein
MSLHVLKGEREKLGIPAGTLVIEYPFDVGGQLKDRFMWMGRIDGEVEDYHLKKVLIENAEKEKRPWVVLTRHRDGTLSIAERSGVKTCQEGQK